MGGKYFKGTRGENALVPLLLVLTYLPTYLPPVLCLSHPRSFISAGAHRAVCFDLCGAMAYLRAPSDAGEREHDALEIAGW